MDGVNKWIEMGNEILVSLNKARAHMMATVDDLVEEGTLSRAQGEAILEAWKKRATDDASSVEGESATESTAAFHESPLIQSLFEKWSNVAPASREEIAELRQRIERIEAQINRRPGE